MLILIFQNQTVFFEKDLCIGWIEVILRGK